MPRPAVSIVVPMYNGAARIGETIDSVLAQTMEDWELLAIDDHSADATASIVRAYQDPRIRCLTHPNDANLGCCATRIHGCDEASAPVIALIDQDDVWEPEYLERHLDFWSRVDHDVALSFGPAIEWWPEEPARNRVLPTPAPGVHAPGSLLMGWLEDRHATSGLPSTMFLRPGVYREVAARYVGLARRSGSEDQYLKWPLAARYAIAVHDEALVRYRAHDVAVSRTRPVSEYLKDHLTLYEAMADDFADVLPRHPIHRALRARVRELRRDLRKRRVRHVLSRVLQRTA